MKFIDRFRAKASKSKQVQSRLKSLDKIEKIEIPRINKRVNYSFLKSPRSGKEVIKLKNLHKSRAIQGQHAVNSCTQHIL